MSQLPPPCLKQQELIESVQAHLSRLAELARSATIAIADRNENTIMKLDREIEEEIGEKERAMGALRQHRTEHGC